MKNLIVFGLILIIGLTSCVKNSDFERDTDAARKYCGVNGDYVYVYDSRLITKAQTDTLFRMGSYIANYPYKLRNLSSFTGNTSGSVTGSFFAGFGSVHTQEGQQKKVIYFSYENKPGNYVIAKFDITDISYRFIAKTDTCKFMFEPDGKAVLYLYEESLSKDIGTVL